MLKEKEDNVLHLLLSLPPSLMVLRREKNKGHGDADGGSSLLAAYRRLPPSLPQH